MFTGILAAAGYFAQFDTGDNATAAEFEQIVKTADRATRDLFPPPVSAAINSARATHYFLPDSTHTRLDGTAGTENFCILSSKSDLDLEGLVGTIRESGVTLYQGVKDKLGPRLLELEQVNVRDDRISFQAPADERSVRCFFIEMDHR